MFFRNGTVHRYTNYIKDPNYRLILLFLEPGKSIFRPGTAQFLDQIDYFIKFGGHFLKFI